MPAGTIALTNGSTKVSGIGTSFSAELKAGDFMYVNVGGAPYTIVASAVVSDIEITLTETFTGPTSTGLSWNSVPALLQMAITQKVINDFAQVARGRILDFENWQGIYSDEPSVTVMRPDRTQYTGPSWGHIAKVVGAVEDPLTNLVPLSRQYMTLAAAQADIVNIPEGSTTYVRSSDDNALAAEYRNVTGTLQATGRKMASYDATKNLSTLNEKTTYLRPEDVGPFSKIYDRLCLDSNNEIISYSIGNDFTNLMRCHFNYIDTELLKVNGLSISGGNFLDEKDKVNIEVLSNAQTFVNFDNSNEYPFSEPFDYIVKDSTGDIMWAFRGDKYFSFMKCFYDEMDVSKLSVNGAQIDVSAILLPKDAINITALSNQSQFETDSQFPFNPTAWTVFDKNNDVIFRVEDYWLALQTIGVLQGKVSELQNEVSNLSSQKNTLSPFSGVDGAGVYQVFVYDTDTKTQVQVTTGSSNETAPRADDNDRIVWNSDRNDNAPGGLFYAALPDLKPHAYIARKKIVGWGHSFINNGKFLNRLNQLSGIPTYNFGLSGQTSDAIASRQGGSPTYYAPVGGFIPSSGPVTLSPSVPGPCRSLAAPVNLLCGLSGVDGTFVWDGTNATFTRTSAGDAVSVAQPTPLYVYPVTTAAVSGGIPIGTLYEPHDECINIFWIGRNNLRETELIFDNIVSMVEYVKNIGKKIVILADFNSSAEPIGSDGYKNMSLINGMVKEKYPEYYCEINGVDIRQNFINHHNPASSDDVSDIELGLTPRSLRYDNLHPSQQISGSGGSLTPDLALEIGANVNAEFVYQFITSKGWL